MARLQQLEPSKISEAPKQLIAGPDNCDPDYDGQPGTREKTSSPLHSHSGLTNELGPRSAKRRRVEDVPKNDSPEADQYTRHFDPHQDANERRETRKGLRKILKDVHDHRHEYLQPESTGLQDALHRLNGFQSTVKQTSDATIDSKTLVDVGDLTLKKTQRLVLRDSAQGVDVDEFVSKCVTFMKRTKECPYNREASSGSRHQQSEPADDEYNEQGDALDWAWLGTYASVQGNAKPAMTGFLLGPLSLQRKARAQRLRKTRQLSTLGLITKPQEVREVDLGGSDNSDLVNMCRSVLSRLQRIKVDGQSAANEDYHEGMSPAEEAELLRRHHLCDNSGVSLFDFAINPRSFGQTVENLFYISFLVKDGYVGIDKDSSNTPTLHLTASEDDADDMIRTKEGKRHQGVFSLDYSLWKELIQVYDIRESLIQHRADNFNSDVELGM